MTMTLSKRTRSEIERVTAAAQQLSRAKGDHRELAELERQRADLREQQRMLGVKGSIADAEDVASRLRDVEQRWREKSEMHTSLVAPYTRQLADARHELASAATIDYMAAAAGHLERIAGLLNAAIEEAYKLEDLRRDVQAQTGTALHDPRIQQVISHTAMAAMRCEVDVYGSGALRVSASG